MHGAGRHERAARERIATADRLATFSDAVIAVIMTVTVLELRAPDRETLSALWPLWPTVISYAVSYLFIAIIWTCSALILHLRPEVPGSRP